MVGGDTQATYDAEYISAEVWFLLAPTTLLATLATGGVLMKELGAFGASVAWESVLHGSLALLALLATWRAYDVFRGQGAAGLRALTTPVIFAMGMGLALVASGGVAISAMIFLPGMDWGTIPANVLGFPAVVPCVHLLVLRARALRSDPAFLPSSMKLRYTLFANAVVLVALVGFQWVSHGPLPFDQALWRDPASSGPYPPFLRHRMADSLVLHGTLVGLGSDEVQALLGPPQYGGDSSRMKYELGEARGIDGCCGEYLLLTLDSRGRVIDAYTYLVD
jgi:hypothetical protein